MKTKIFFAPLLITAFFVSACNVNDQGQTATERERIDSMEMTDRNLHDQMDDAKADRRESEARTKDARLVEKNASNASSESRKALRAEKKAQRSRSRADEQARKSEDAIDKSEQDQ